MCKDELKNEFKRILLKTLEDFILLCEEKNLRYYAAFGTVLGAVRHGGMIPWDDDIDVYMPREDYNRLLSMRNDLKNDYELVDLENDGYYQDFAKFVNRKTTIIESKEISSISALLTMPKLLTVWITTNWKILQEMGIPDHLTCLLRNLYAVKKQ